MSVSADPAATAAFSFLKSDGVKIPLRSRFLTRRQKLQHAALCDALAGKSMDDDIWDQVFEIIDIGIVGTTRAELEDTLSDTDLIILAMRYPIAVERAEAELGKSLSRRVFVGAEPVATATAESASTPQLPPAP